VRKHTSAKSTLVRKRTGLKAERMGGSYPDLNGTAQRYSGGTRLAGFFRPSHPCQLGGSTPSPCTPSNSTFTPPAPQAAQLLPVQHAARMLARVRMTPPCAPPAPPHGGYLLVPVCLRQAPVCLRRAHPAVAARCRQGQPTAATAGLLLGTAVPQQLCCHTHRHQLQQILHW
jgi:hypothetical protein